MGPSDFELAAQSVLAQTRKWFLTRFDVKPGGNLDEDQDQDKQRSLSQFDMIFVGILGGDQSKRKRFDLVSSKISLLVHILKPAACKARFAQSCFRRNLTNFRDFSGLFLASNHFSVRARFGLMLSDSGLY